MKASWFRPWGWVYRPVSAPGVIAVVLAAAFCAQIFVAIDRRSHSVSDTLYGIFPFWVCTFLLLNWVAAKSSERAG